MSTLSNKKGAKTSNNSMNEFVCVLCDYKCSKKYNLDRHILSSKHIKSTKINNLSTKIEQNEQNEQKNTGKYHCEKCNKEYSDRSGLWRHKKKCVNIYEVEESESEEDDLSDKQLILMLINQNKELMEIVKNGTHNTNNSNHTNSHNKT